MATKVIMPKLGMAMSEGTVVKWLKPDGAEVKAGDQPVVMAGTRAEAEAGNLNKSTNQDFL